MDESVGPVSIRAANSNDARAIASLLGQLGYPTTPEQVARRLERLRGTGADTLLVAELDRCVVGLAGLHVSPSLEHDREAAKVSVLVVDERYRRRGVGEALLEAVEAEARSRGSALLFLTTAERRGDAHAFYERQGLEHTGRRFAKWLA